MIRTSHSKRARGLTLVELMVSMFVLGVMAVSLLYGFIGAKKVSEATMLHSMTAEVAQSYLEQIKRMSYDTLREVIADPATKKLDTYRSNVVGNVAAIVPHPLTIGQDNSIPITMDIRDGNVSTFTMQMRPELRDLTNLSEDLPAVEVTLHYTFTSTSTTAGKVINRRVQYVIPRLGQPAEIVTP